MRIDRNKLILIVVAAVLTIALIALVVVALGDLKDRNNDVPDFTTVPTLQTQEGKDVEVPTPYGTLVFPSKWSKYVRISRTEDPELEIHFEAAFPSGKTQKLFDICFAGAQAPAVGQVVTADGVAVGVHVTHHLLKPDGSWSVNEIDAASEMLESLDDVLAGLNMVPVGTPVPVVDGETMSMETPYCKLYLPKRWLEEIRVSLDESKGYYQLIFEAVIGNHDPEQVFIISFGGDASVGSPIGLVKTENDVPILIRMHTPTPDTSEWGSVDRATWVALQESCIEELLKEIPGKDLV